MRSGWLPLFVPVRVDGGLPGNDARIVRETTKVKLFKNFVKTESGAAIVEYGLALLVVAAIAVGAFNALGTTTNDNVQAACGAVGATC